MQIIEYFNFKNKPLTKEEKNSIKVQVDEFMSHLENQNKHVDANNPILNTDDIHTKIDMRKLCYEIVSKGIGKIIYTTINDTFIYSIFVDIGQCFNHEANNPVVLNALKSIAKFKATNTKKEKEAHINSLNEKYRREIKYLKKDINDVCPTTCLFITNLNFDSWFISGSPIKALLSAFPCYNLLGLTNEEITDEQIDLSNETRTYSFSSA